MNNVIPVLPIIDDFDPLPLGGRGNVNNLIPILPINDDTPPVGGRSKWDKFIFWLGKIIRWLNKNERQLLHGNLNNGIHAINELWTRTQSGGSLTSQELLTARTNTETSQARIKAYNSRKIVQLLPAMRLPELQNHEYRPHLKEAAHKHIENIYTPLWWKVSDAYRQRLGGGACVTDDIKAEINNFENDKEILVISQCAEIELSEELDDVKKYMARIELLNAIDNSLIQYLRQLLNDLQNDNTLRKDIVELPSSRYRILYLDSEPLSRCSQQWEEDGFGGLKAKVTSNTFSEDIELLNGHSNSYPRNLKNTINRIYQAYLPRMISNG